jgi:hypothetical protein
MAVLLASVHGLMSHFRTPHPRGYHRVRPFATAIPPSFLLVPVNSIKSRLMALKKDQGDLIKPSDVNSLYQAVIKQGP